MSYDDEAELSPVASLFASFLDRVQAGEAAEIEALCAEHPEHAAALRRMHANLARVGMFFDDAVEPGVAPACEPKVEKALLEELRSAAATDRYEPVGEVGRGGMGVVHEVFDKSLRRRLAMKVLLGSGPGRGPGSASNTRALSRFLEEAQITGQLEHPGVVPVHELGLDEHGDVYFTMSLVRGRSLSDIAKLARDAREGWTLTRAVDVVLRVCETLAYAHARGVVHRDLKPANVMVGPFGETYVLDWGLARVLAQDDTKDLRLRAREDRGSERPDTVRVDAADTPGSDLRTMDGDVVGTPAYMAPEQAAGRIAEVGVRSDVYSLGAILYHVIAGRMPYVSEGEHPSGHEVLARAAAGPPRPPPRARP